MLGSDKFFLALSLLAYLDDASPRLDIYPVKARSRPSRPSAHAYGFDRIDLKTWSRTYKTNGPAYQSSALPSLMTAVGKAMLRAYRLAPTPHTKYAYVMARRRSRSKRSSSRCFGISFDLSVSLFLLEGRSCLFHALSQLPISSLTLLNAKAR